MNPLPPAQAERAALCDLFLQLGPDEPTLCEGWTTYDLVAHLDVREHDPVASIGIVVPPAVGLHDRAIVRDKERRSFEQLVSRVRNGPPFWLKPVDGAINTQEYFIHHEDARRGGGDTTPRPEADVADVETALWNNLGRSHRFMTRGVKDVGVDLVAPDRAPIRARRRDPVVTIAGRPGEILLYLFGRRGAAHVDISGSPAACAALEDASLGL
jgi:uncharacterized protein (TIGR03085 family)